MIVRIRENGSLVWRVVVGEVVVGGVRWRGRRRERVVAMGANQI